MKNLIGTTLGQYEITEKIGQGGMAHVFKAYQPGLDRYVAVKVLPPALALEPGFTERFQREAQSVARLHHPNILQVHDFGQQDQFYFIAMRYVNDSRTLGDMIRANSSMDQLVNYIVQVADALNYAHDQGIIHRDVKPGNILIDGKWAMLTDFGLVKMAQTSKQLTGTGISMGTPAYMSPEQATGKEVDRRTDIYALGVILYRVLTGSVPHDAPTPIAIAIKRNTEPVTSLREIQPDIPESIEHVVLRTLAIEPDRRYDTATDFADALKTAKIDPGFREHTVTDMMRDATVISSAPLPEPTRKRSNTAFIVGGVAVALIVVGALLFFLLNPSDDSEAQTLSSGDQSGSGLQAAAIPPTDTPDPPTNTPPAPTDTPQLPADTPVSARAPSAKAVERLEIRSGPGDEYDLLGYLPANAVAEVTSSDEAGQWWQIKSSLAGSGTGWITANPESAEVTAVGNVPIALAPATPTGTATAVPNTPTPTDTASPTDTPVPSTATSTATASATSTATASASPSATATATSSPTRSVVTSNTVAPPTPTPVQAPRGEFALIKPASLDNPSFGMTEFEWQWNSPLNENQGFEVRVWRDGANPAGVHDAVLDNKQGKIQAVGNNTYRLRADIANTPGVLNRSGTYNWTVFLIEYDPAYKDLGMQARPPGRLRFEAPGSGGGGGGDSGGSGGGGGVGGGD